MAAKPDTEAEAKATARDWSPWLEPVRAVRDAQIKQPTLYNATVQYLWKDHEVPDRLAQDLETVLHANSFATEPLYQFLDQPQVGWHLQLYDATTINVQYHAERARLGVGVRDGHRGEAAMAVEAACRPVFK